MTDRGNSRISPEFALLGFLYQAPSYGYELHQRLRGQFGYVWHASQSQTYNILKRLEKQGFIRSRVIEQEKHPARQQLEITAPGSQRFVNWLKQPTKSSVHAIRVEFTTRLYFCQRYIPELTQRIISEQIEMVEADYRQLQQGLDALDDKQSFNRLALELRLELLGSVIRWLDRCRQTFWARGTGAARDE